MERIVFVLISAVKFQNILASLVNVTVSSSITGDAFAHAW